MNGDHSVVIANFRLASFLPDPEVDIGVPAPECNSESVRWLAPELLFPEKFGMESTRLTKETDVYAFAMVVYEVSRLLRLSSRTPPRAFIRNSFRATGFFWVIPLRWPSGRSSNPADKIGRPSAPTRGRFRSWSHGRIVEGGKGLVVRFHALSRSSSATLLMQPQCGDILNSIVAPTRCPRVGRPRIDPVGEADGRSVLRKND